MRLSLKKRVAIKVWQHLFGSLPHRVVTREKAERITGWGHHHLVNPVTGIELEMKDVLDPATSPYPQEFSSWRVKVLRVRVQTKLGTYGEWLRDTSFLSSLQVQIAELEEEYGEEDEEKIRYIVA